MLCLDLGFEINGFKEQLSVKLPNINLTSYDNVSFEDSVETKILVII